MNLELNLHESLGLSPGDPKFNTDYNEKYYKKDFWLKSKEIKN